MKGFVESLMLKLVPGDTERTVATRGILERQQEQGGYRRTPGIGGILEGQWELKGILE